MRDPQELLDKIVDVFLKYKPLKKKKTKERKKSKVISSRIKRS